MSRRGAAWLLLALGSCQPTSPPPASPDPRPVKIFTVRGQGVDAGREWPGRVEPSQNAEISFDVPGKLVVLDAEEGATVPKGQVLGRLDATDYEARLSAQQATLKQSRLEYRRDQELVAQGVVAKSELDARERMLDVAGAAVQEARKALEDTELRAPFTGTIAKVLVDNFQSVQAKQTILVLQDASSLQIVTDVPERDLAAARPGLTIEERNARISAKVRIDALPGRELPAELKEIATVPDPITRTYEVTWGFVPPSDVGILPGMTAKIVLSDFERPGEPSGVFVPSYAVLGADDEGGAYVWRLEPATMTVHRADVTLGELRHGTIEVLSGLAAGDRIATSGAHELREGLAVTDFDEVFETARGS
ncbi:efflux RND transporter periplasmic adaptor subunit [Paraliomyxa miuraensis]|uniref:efflux RND transporter periplasmic adaptor subunit n=1 Tax=Paraliomyxa miuraensis TaxID=376150 RepID=UPI00224CE657|nr:efflux RND transporter periplasmic adaptor subunit [Paraliomyxa miuraensis]MCX4240715.1 efflux RND transporter periplasmic adaptor subunit [Paraliomyxa miuraensis]